MLDFQPLSVTCKCKIYKNQNHPRRFQENYKVLYYIFLLRTPYCPLNNARKLVSQFCLRKCSQDLFVAWHFVLSLVNLDKITCVQLRFIFSSPRFNYFLNHNRSSSLSGKRVNQETHVLNIIIYLLLIFLFVLWSFTFSVNVRVKCSTVLEIFKSWRGSPHNLLFLIRSEVRTCISRVPFFFLYCL